MTHFTEQKTKLSITHAGNKYKAVLPWDANIESVFDALFGLLVAAGYHQDSIEDEIISWAEEFKKAQK